jgi:L-lactate dehydrogenase complex protein LldF
MGARVLSRLGQHLPMIGPLKEWTRVRTPPPFAPKTLHELAHQRGLDDDR